MKVNRRRVAAAGVVTLALAGIGQAWSALAAPGDPQLGLRVATPHVQVERIEGDPFIWADLGTYVGVTGAALEIEAQRGADGMADLWLVHRDRSGKIHRDRRLDLPTRAPMFLGLSDFMEVSIANSKGAVVSKQSLGFCPGGGWMGDARSRIDGSGPAESTMPSTCGSDLTQHIVYGLDKGWAASVGNEVLGNFEGPDGDYSVTVAIARTYVDQFRIPADRAKSSLTMSIKTVPCPWGPEYCGGGGGGGYLAPSSGGSTAPTSADASTASTGEAGHGAHGHGGSAKLDPIVLAAAADVNAKAARSATVSSSPALRRISERAHPQRTNQPEADSGRRAGGLPDLVPLPAFGFSTFPDETGRDQLGFGANLANLGSGPLVVEGFRRGQDTMAATQYEYRDGAPVRSFPAGEFEWDGRGGHNHWHFEDVAQYDLVGANGSVTRSGKQSFCLAPTDPIDLTRPGAVQQVQVDRMWSACGGSSALWIREVLPAGWGDTYYQGLPGQSFDITDLPNGTYSVRVTTNFRGRLHETNTSNNVSTRQIEIGGAPGERTVTELS